MKVVYSRTKEFKIASNKRDLFLGFSEQLERLRKKLALEEGRIFAANEQLSKLFVLKILLFVFANM